MNLSTTYEPKKFEDDIYELWMSSGAFAADPSKKAPRFSISMPPPNATGTLHVGHTLGIAIQDIMARYNRMNGKDVLWLPGTDHAALATNAIMEKRLTDEGTTKHEVGREVFVDRLKEFIAESQDTMRSQIRAVGASCDWGRERYTLDNALNRCVNETFIKMYKDELIYRGHRIVNWDPNLETTVSDDEIVRIEEKGKFYTFKYGPFHIGTARPETKFGDKYVVMHPKDKRYAKYKHGDTFTAEWINGPITATVIKDESVDPEFGTGVMTITPWHDHTDFEIAERHGLDKEQIIDFNGKLLAIADEFSGMHISEAREKIVAKLDKKGLLVAVDEDYIHNVALNDRGKGVIEPQIKLQWFVDVNKQAVPWKGKTRSLKEVMQAVINDQDITIVPQRFNKTYFHWIDNLRDWCISRQIWWGHRIPVWYQTHPDETVETYVGLKPPTPEPGQPEWIQDPDTLDTWFSSALWTWSTLIDPTLADDLDLSLEEILARSVDYQTYHPTSVMETGWDILFFWVARMILATTYMTGEVPFKTVYLHGLVRAEDGQKMSKSKPETMIDPLEVIPKYGTDALRLALIYGISPGNDSRMSIAKIIGQRNFCNKLWNVARFVEGVVGDDHTLRAEAKAETIADQWMLSKLQHGAEKISADLDNFRFAEAYDTLYHLVWDDFADWYIEASKGSASNAFLAYCLEVILKLAHPFAPFVTETIWQTLAWEGDSILAVATWPAVTKADAKQATAFEAVKTLVTEMRSINSNLKKPVPTATTRADDPLAPHVELIDRLARVTTTVTADTPDGLKLAENGYAVWLDLDADSLADLVQALTDKQQTLEGEIANLEKRLSNKAYIDKAPEKLVAETKSQLADKQAQSQAVNADLARLS